MISVAPQMNLSSTLQRTLDPSTRKQGIYRKTIAEEHLNNLQTTEEFCGNLLQLVQDPSVNDHVRFSAVLFFKNFCKKYWDPPNETDAAIVISQGNRDLIKANIVQLLISMPSKLQDQLSEVVSIIADTDFPGNWPNLLPDLISRLNLEYHQVNLGVLQTCHSIFKRWRSQMRSDGLFLEIKYVLEHFAQPFLAFLQAIDKQIDSGNVLGPLYDQLLVCVKIFHDLVCQDLPEFVEDNMAAFMGIWKKHLIFNNPSLETSDDEEVGPLEKVKTEICQVVELFCQRYEDEFKDLPVFVECIWNLLTSTGPQVKYDLLVSRAMGFLTSVVRQQRHKPLFENPQVLSSICNKIVLPNIELRESDVELFEDDPVEYIKRDLEGSDNDTRRRAASDLIRGLNILFSAQITPIFGEHIMQYLSKYNQNKQANWKCKDSSLYLMIAVSASGTSSQYGATQVNPLISIDQVFKENIYPDLVEGSRSQVHPIIIVDCIKYILTFRTLLGNPLEAFQVLADYLGSKDFIVYTYAAICIEKILSTRLNGSPLIPDQNVAAASTVLIQKLMQILGNCGSSAQKLSDNEHVIKAVLRVLLLSKEATSSISLELVKQLTSILAVIAQNPVNPRFNHFMFESLATLIRFNCLEANVYEIEACLFPTFQAILSADISEFMPYVFQLLSQLLDKHKVGDLSDLYKMMVTPLTQPTLWQATGNIPALTRLMQSYVEKGTDLILVQQNQLAAFLGVVQKLLASKANDHFGLDLLFTVFSNLPVSTMNPYIPNIFMLLLNRLSGSKTMKFSRGFTTLVCALIVLGKPGFAVDEIIRVMNSIQPNLFFNIFQHIVLPEFESIATEKERRLVVAAGSILIVQSSEFASQPQLLSPLLTNLVKLISKSLVAEKQVEEIIDFDQDDATVQTAYSKLNVISNDKCHVTKMSTGLGEPKALLAQSVGAADASVKSRIQAAADPGVLAMIF